MDLDVKSHTRRLKLRCCHGATEKRLSHMQLVESKNEKTDNEEEKRHHSICQLKIILLGMSKTLAAIYLACLDK